MSISVQEVYESRYHGVLVPLATRLKSFFEQHFTDIARIDRISVRAKNIDRFMAKSKKSQNGIAKYRDPINQIQDQLGARIVTYYLSDVDRVSEEVSKVFRSIEQRTLIPDDESSFGYIGKHLILLMPTDVVDDSCKVETPPFFELQIKTLFQHAWSEAEHDLSYKSFTQLTSDQKRMIAFTAAQAWGADRIFSELHEALRS